MLSLKPKPIVIVSRHRSTIEYISTFLKQKGIDYDVKEHVNNIEELNQYSLAIGNIPLEMFIRSKLQGYIQINLTIPRELRGKELSLEELEKYAKFIAIIKEQEYPNGVRAYIMLFENLKEVFEYAKSLSP